MRGEIICDHSFPRSNRCEKALLGMSEKKFQGNVGWMRGELIYSLSRDTNWETAITPIGLSSKYLWCRGKYL